MKKTCLIFIPPFFLFMNTNSNAQSHSVEEYFDGYMLGVALRYLDAGNFVIADIPLIEARIPLAKDVLQFKYGGNLIWGVTDFFVEWNYAAGILFYPFSKYFGINATCRLGSFFLDNISYMGAIGANFAIPFGRNRIVSVEVEYFYRNSEDLLDFVSFGSGNGDEVINIDSYGIGIGIGFRF